MKKIVVMSDNHGNHIHPYLLLALEEDADYFVHCGDNCGDDADLEKYYAVRGNSDIFTSLPEEVKFTCEGLTFGVIHGHQFGWGLSEKVLFQYMNQEKYDILFFGHIHRQVYVRERNKVIINPGSTARSRLGPESYAVVTVENKEIISVEFKEI